MLLQPRIKFFSSAKILSIPRRIHGHTELGNKETLTSISSIICLYISLWFAIVFITWPPKMASLKVNYIYTRRIFKKRNHCNITVGYFHKLVAMPFDRQAWSISKSKRCRIAFVPRHYLCSDFWDGVSVTLYMFVWSVCTDACTPRWMLVWLWT